MPPRKRFSGASLCHLLEQHGFVAIRQKGSHRVMQKQLNTTTITVPIPMHKDLKPGTLGSIIRQSQLDRAIFEQ
jgi:predicted RNA binding protein YcfA (HicA-like mRNA interferase family)